MGGFVFLQDRPPAGAGFNGIASQAPALPRNVRTWVVDSLKSSCFYGPSLLGCLENRFISGLWEPPF